MRAKRGTYSDGTVLCQGGKDGCGRPAIARGMCLMHYKRVRYRDSIERTTWEGRKKHPLYQCWRNVKRNGCILPWRDFWTFVRDVGERPSKEHRLVPNDANQLMGPDNFTWLPTLPYDFSTQEGRKAYNRFYRTHLEPKVDRRAKFRMYGITEDEYKALLKKQGNVCAVCKKRERVMRHGKVQSLSIDHDHSSGQIRGLLCVNCNRILGHAHDNKDILRAAIEYLANAALAAPDGE